MVIFLIASPTELLFLNYNYFGSFALFALFFGLLNAARGPWWSAGTGKA